MKIIMSHYDQTVTIERDEDALTIDEVEGELLRPALVALGYHPNLVDRLFASSDYSYNSKTPLMDEEDEDNFQKGID